MTRLKFGSINSIYLAAVGTVALSAVMCVAAETTSGESSAQTQVSDVTDSLPRSALAEREVAKAPTNRAARLEAARAHLAEGADMPSRVEAAQRHALAVLEESPADVEALLIAGQTSLLKGEAIGAAQFYRAATSVDPSSATAFLGLGDALSRLADESGARAAFKTYETLQGITAADSNTRER